MDLLIRGAALALPGGPKRGDLGIKQGKISCIAPHIDQPAQTVLDAQGMLLLPGGVDLLAGFDLLSMNQNTCDGWQAGSSAALAGGTTTVGVQLLPSADAGSSLTGYLLRNALEQGRRGRCDFSLHGPALPENNVIELRETPEQLLSGGINSWMAELCGEYALSGQQLDSLFAGASACGALLMLRAEAPEHIRLARRELLQSDRLTPNYFPTSRPPEAELQAVQMLIELAHRHNDAPLLLCGISTAEALSEIAAARSRGQQRLFCATSPQYLLLDEIEYYQGERRALRASCAPPLRTMKDQDALWQGLEQGVIDIIESDHRSFSYFSKRAGRNDLRRTPLGVPGVEERLTLILSEGVARRRISLKRAVSALCGRPAALGGLSYCKGALRKGLDADLVLFDPHCEQRFSDVRLHGEADYSLYGDLRLIGQVRRVWLRGQPAYAENIIATELHGSFIPAASLFSR